MSDLRAALVAIQELHKPVVKVVGFGTYGEPISKPCCSYCTRLTEPGNLIGHPCRTRRLADEALGGDTDG